MSRARGTGARGVRVPRRRARRPARARTRDGGSGVGGGAAAARSGGGGDGGGAWPVDASSLRLEHSVRGQPSDGSPRRLQLLSRDGAGPPTVGDADGAAAAARARTPPAAGGAWAVEGGPDPVPGVAREQWAREASGEARRAEEAATALRIEPTPAATRAAAGGGGGTGARGRKGRAARGGGGGGGAEAAEAPRGSAEHAEAAAAAATARAERACAALHQLLVRAGRRQAAWEKAVAAVPNRRPARRARRRRRRAGRTWSVARWRGVDAAAAELGGWIDETHEALVDADRRRERARAQLSAEAALDDAVREASARAGRADRRSRHLVGAVHALGRDAVDLAEGAAPAAESAA